MSKPSKLVQALGQKFPKKTPRDALITLLSEHNGSDARAATALGVWPNSVRYAREKYGIEIRRNVEIEEAAS